MSTLMDSITLRSWNPSTQPFLVRVSISLDLCTSSSFIHLKSWTWISPMKIQVQKMWEDQLSQDQPMVSKLSSQSNSNTLWTKRTLLNFTWDMGKTTKTHALDMLSTSSMIEPPSSPQVSSSRILDRFKKIWGKLSFPRGIENALQQSRPYKFPKLSCQFSTRMLCSQLSLLVRLVLLQLRLKTTPSLIWRPRSSRQPSQPLSSLIRP